MKRALNTFRILPFEQALREANEGKEFLNIGPTPYNEKCTQPGINYSDSIFECILYIRQLIRTYGPPPEGCEFFIVRNNDFGIYYDVNIFYGTDLTSAVENHSSAEDYVQKVESGLDFWDHESIQELIINEHHLHIAPVIKINKSA
jgi:hypothetical protein